MLTEDEKIMVLSALWAQEMEAEKQVKECTAIANDEFTEDKKHWENTIKYWMKRANEHRATHKKIMRLRCKQ